MDPRIVEAADNYNVDKEKLEELVIDIFGFDFEMEDVEACAEELAK